jgi:L-2,4-diaminobutyric acid acetyltransferase
MQEASNSRSEGFRLRHPMVRDGSALWRLVGDAGTLDLNSAYAYLMVCRDFADTCIVAEDAGRLAGFVIGYRPPPRPDTVFVWQIGVAPDARGLGLGGRILDALLEADACAGVRFLDTNVTPSNAASRAMFHALARRLDAGVEELEGFESTLFPDPSHEPERLLRIGPFRPRKESR